MVHTVLRTARKISRKRKQMSKQAADLAQALEQVFGDSPVRVILARDESVDVIIRGGELAIYSDDMLTQSIATLKSKSGKVHVLPQSLPFYNAGGVLVVPVRWKGKNIAFYRFDKAVPVERLESVEVVAETSLYSDSGLTNEKEKLPKGKKLRILRTANKAIAEVFDGNRSVGFLRSGRVKRV